MATPRIPVLLTSSVIAHDRQVSLTDSQARLQLALESVAQWLRVDPATPLVLCDGSGHDFGAAVRSAYPAATIECLHFDNDQAQVRQRGRGWGEGEIVRYALDHSVLIGQYQCFAKCSSKLWVDNFQACARNWRGGLMLKGVFGNVFSVLRPTTLDYIDTRFYIASVDSYRRYLLDAHYAIDVARGYGLEQCFSAVLRSQRLQAVLLTRAPVIEGVGGGTGRAYRNPRLRIAKEALRLWLVRRNAAWRALFYRAPDTA